MTELSRVGTERHGDRSTVDLLGRMQLLTTILVIRANRPDHLPGLSRQAAL